eukprot:9492006-Pyramimonas_sp.AAC.1
MGRGWGGRFFHRRAWARNVHADHFAEQAAGARDVDATQMKWLGSRDCCPGEKAHHGGDARLSRPAAI